MIQRPRIERLLGICLLTLLGVSALACVQSDSRVAGGTDGSTGAPLTIERLYSLPNLIGTAPQGFAWAPDSSRVAFLWNNEGLNFLDVWVVEAGSDAEGPVRWTQLPQLTADTASADRKPEQWTESESEYLAAVEQEKRERDPGATAVRWHPDGARIVLSLRGDLWIAERNGDPQPFIKDAARAAFSPSGKHVAFLRAGDVWAAGADGTQLRRLTRIATDGVRIANFRWSPNGQQVAVLASDRSAVRVRGIPDYLADETTFHEVRRAYPGEEHERQRLGVIDLSHRSTAEPVRWISLATPAPDMLLSYRWSPDGRRLAVDTSDLFAKDRRVFVAAVPQSGGLTQMAPARLIAQDADPLNESFYFWRIEWSVDGSQLYFLSDRALAGQETADFHVWSVPANGGEAMSLTSGDWAVAEMFPVKGGLVVVGNRDRAEERHLYSVNQTEAADGQAATKIQQVTRRAGTHTPVVSPDGRWAATLHSADDSPPDLLMTDVTNASERQVTHSPIPEFEQFNWVTPEYVEFESHVDATPLHGRLTLPPNFDPSRRYPAILGSVYTDSVRNQWGGRTAHPTWALDQYLAQEGYVLLNVDMRGSWGRGRDHRRGIRLDYGGMDIEDLESGVRFLGSLGYVDLDRVGIWGSSYGGLMTAMSLFRKPGLYAAGVAGAPATNVGHALMGQMAVMMRPQDQGEEYADSSAYLHGHGLSDALMIIHGMRDQVVLYKDSMALTQRLLQMGKDVELVTLPNAGHGWDNEGLAQTRYAFRNLVRHFDRHLKN